MQATAFGIAGALFALAVVGIPTDVIPNNLFTRMTPVRDQDYVFLALTGLLSGLLAATYALPLPASCAPREKQALAGGLISFFAVGCPICNKLVLLLLGTSGALTYFQPIQPILGVASVALLAATVIVRWRPVLRNHTLRLSA